MSTKRHIHLMGIGGIGMSALAQVQLAAGAKVSGCDLKKNTMIRKLQESGIQFVEAHHFSHLENIDVLVYTSAISHSAEIDTAKKRGIPVYKRGEFLAELINQQWGIAICGAHGKTTTTSLITTVLKEAGLDPTYLIGGEVETLGGNAHRGSGTLWVTEADESDGSFLQLRPKIGVVTHVDREHLDFYKSEEEIGDAYQKFMRQTSKEGVLVACLDDPWIKKLIRKIEGPLVTYGKDSTCEIRASNVLLFPFASEFDLIWKGQSLVRSRINIPGEHNVLNALAAFAVGIQLGLSPEQIVASLLTFHGVKRRFQIKNTSGDIWVIDDYAHHPTEIQATLKSAKGLGRSRTIGVFQPHRYTRTHALLNEFSQVLQPLDHLILTEIYSASEPPIPGVSGGQLYEKVVEYGHPSCEFLEKERIPERLMNLARPGDTLLFLGAGDITQVADEVAEKLRSQIF